jgi:hypothetical protein
MLLVTATSHPVWKQGISTTTARRREGAKKWQRIVDAGPRVLPDVFSRLRAVVVKNPCRRQPRKAQG